MADDSRDDTARVAGGTAGVNSADDDGRWATRHGTFAPGVGADGRVPRGSRPQESPSELFARTSKLPGPEMNDLGLFSDNLIRGQGMSAVWVVTAVVVASTWGIVVGFLVMWVAAITAALVNSGLHAYPRVPAWARIVLSLGLVVALVAASFRMAAA